MFFLLFARLRSLNLTLASIRKPPPTNLALTSPIEKPTAGQLISIIKKEYILILYVLIFYSYCFDYYCMQFICLLIYITDLLNIGAYDLL